MGVGDGDLRRSVLGKDGSGGTREKMNLGEVEEIEMRGFTHLSTEDKEVGNSCVLTHEAQLLQSCLTLCNPMDCSPPGSPVRGFSRQEYCSE